MDVRKNYERRVTRKNGKWMNGKKKQAEKKRKLKSEARGETQENRNI
jgi:hypothetical protein